MNRELRKSDCILAAAIFLILGIVCAWGAYWSFAQGSYAGVIVTGCFAVMAAAASLAYLCLGLGRRERSGREDGSQ